MPNVIRRRLARCVRAPDCDLAEAGLLVSALADRSVDPDLWLLRVDALADALRVTGPRPTDPERAARWLGDYLGEQQGFRGDLADYHDPRNGLLSEVLERRQGLPITLSVLYVSIARRIGVPAFPIALPGHVVVGIAGPERPVVIDPFHRGVGRTEADLADLVESISQGRARFHRAMLRPANATSIVRRILDNLTRDYLRANRPADAVWTVEAKLVLPDPPAGDLRVHGDLLMAIGQFTEAARSFEAYLHAAPDADDHDEVVERAIRARASLN